MLHAVLVVGSKDGRWYNKGHSNNAYVLAYNNFAVLNQLWCLLICNTLGTLGYTQVAVIMDSPYACEVRIEAEETVERDCVLCEVRAKADETAEHHAYNIT
jgi:hypothetical protein